MTNLNPKRTFYFIAGETSGDGIGAGIVQELRNNYGDEVNIHGVGGPRMTQAGLSSLFDYSQLAIIGFTEILKHLFTVRARMRETVEDIVCKKPDMLITIDAPGFNKRVVQQVKQRMGTDAPFCVHVVAPTVWAYKPKRAKTFAKIFDHLLVILPFEPPYFIKEGLACDYIGHPSVWEWQHATVDMEGFKRQHKIEPSDTVVGVLLGSRMSELERHWPIFAATLGQLAGSIPNLKTMMPVPSHLREWVEEHIEQWPTPVILVDPMHEKYAAFKSMDVALSKSGTVSLELALAEVPQIVTYQVTALSAWIIRRMIRIPYYSLINILEDRFVFPEHVQEECHEDVLAPALHQLLSASGRKSQLEGTRVAIAKLATPHQQSPAKNAVDIFQQLLATR